MKKVHKEKQLCDKGTRLLRNNDMLICDQREILLRNMIYLPSANVIVTHLLSIRDYMK